jgi:hypothetical protein
MNRQCAPLLVLGTLFLHGCGGGGSTPPPPPVISVSFSTAPPASLGLNASAPVGVTVSNDSANAGATFSCSPAGTCGTFTNTSATSATYNSPAAVPTGGSVTITAASVTDATKNAHANVTINAPAITVTFTLPSSFPSSLPTSAALPVTVSLTNDTNNQGVTFTCAPAGTCGTFTNTSATSATYNSPAAVPAGGSITITATSVAQTTASNTSPSITIAGIASVGSLKGQYTFLVTSPTGSRGTAAWVGSVNLDGAGNLVAVGSTGFAGVEDVVSPVRNDQGDNIYPTATNSASTYTVDATGHGQITMATVRGESLTISFIITFANSSDFATHAEIIEADGAGGEAGDPGSGTLDLQDPTAFSNSMIANTYSFTMTGVQNDVAQTFPPESLGGVLNLSVPTAISGSVDIVTGGVVASSAAGPGSQIDNAPDANGRGTFHVVLPGVSTTRSLTYYVVSSKVMRVFENSNISFTGGSMYSQGSASTALSGPYVYQHAGWSTAGRTVAAGQFSTSSGTISSGISDANSGGVSAITPSTSQAVTGNYTASTTAAGTINFTSFTDAAGGSLFNAYPVDPTLNILDPNNSVGGGGALLLHTDANINGIGVLVPQSSPQVFSLNYALNLQNAIAGPTPNEVDLVGLLSSSTASFGGASNLADYTQASATPNPQLGAPLSGTFAIDPANPTRYRYTGTFSVTSLAGGYSYPTAAPTATATPSTFSVVIYQATTSQAFVVETDTQAITIGQMVQQNP